MKNTNNALALPLPNAIIGNFKSYWATHFLSVLQCLHYQKNFQHLPFKLPIYPVWTLSNLRGTMPGHFFEHIRRQVNNHGFEYFLANFLNSKMNSTVVSDLIRNLSELHGVLFDNKFNVYRFYVVGKDSTLTQAISQKYDHIFPVGNEQELKEVIDNSDICLILTNPSTQQSFGLFGEVEGNHGIDQFRKSYWDRKPRLSCFSMGVVQGNDKNWYIFKNTYNGAEKIHIQFGSQNYVVVDFDKCLEFFQYIFSFGPNSRYPHISDEFGFFASLIIKNWNTPIMDLLKLFESYVDFNEIIATNHIELPIIADIQA